MVKQQMRTKEMGENKEMKRCTAPHKRLSVRLFLAVLVVVLRPVQRLFDVISHGGFVSDLST